MIALRLSEPPEGRNSWTLRLLADNVVELPIVPSISPQMIRRMLKNDITGQHVQYWCIPANANDDFVTIIQQY